MLRIGVHTFKKAHRLFSASGFTTVLPLGNQDVAPPASGSYRSKTAGSGFAGGFTLIELMVVITIIALLASGVLTALALARAKARDARRSDDLYALMQGIELYHNDNLGYPSPAGCAEIACDVTALGEYLVPKYIEKIPVDPRGDTYNKYKYIVNDARDAYGILIRYERRLSDNDAYCKRGVTVSLAWFSTTYPTCP